MWTEIALAWIAIGLFAYLFAMFGMDRFFGEWQQDLLRAGSTPRNPSSCPGCKKNLTTWFSQCVECRECGKVTCRACADYCMGTALWTCSTCVELQEKGPIPSTARYWHPESRSNNLAAVCTAPGSFLDHNTLLCYKKVEGLTADKLGTSVDELNASRLGRVYKDPSYDLLFTRWHGELSACIKDLVHATKLGTDTKNLEEELTALINQIRKTSMEFPQFEMNQAVSTGRETPSYPDILSTAILNRIIINGQDTWVKSVSPVSNDSAVGTDFNSTSELGGGSSSEKDTQHWVLASNASSALERSDEESIGSNWSEGGSKPIVIQESVEEEITTTTYESDGESIGSESSRASSGSDAEDAEMPKGSVQESVANWEHNWLFKRRKELLKQRNALKKPVQMLVPNPNTDSEPMIGDEKVSDIEDFDDYVIVDPKDYESDKSRRSSEEMVETPVEIVKPPTPKPRVHTEVPVKVAVIAETPIPTETKATISPVAAAVPKPVERIAFAEMESKSTAAAKPSTKKSRNSSSSSSSDGDSPTPGKEEPEETLRETSHSLTFNETIEMNSDHAEEAESAPIPEMRIAAREKEKWNHPVKVDYNPYAPENLNKRLKAGHQVPVGSISIDAEDTPDFAEKPRIERFRRDYYVNETKTVSQDSEPRVPVPLPATQQQTAPKPKPIIKSIDSSDRADLDEIHLPSVRSLAMRFNAGSVEDVRPAPRNKSNTPVTLAVTPAKLQLESEKPETAQRTIGISKTIPAPKSSTLVESPVEQRTMTITKTFPATKAATIEPTPAVQRNAGVLKSMPAPKVAIAATTPVDQMIMGISIPDPEVIEEQNIYISAPASNQNATVAMEVSIVAEKTIGISKTIPAPNPNIEVTEAPLLGEVDKASDKSEPDAVKIPKDKSAAVFRTEDVRAMDEVIRGIEDSMVDVVQSEVIEAVKISEVQTPPSPAALPEAPATSEIKEEAEVIQPLYSAFSRSESVPVPHYSTRALISELEQKSKQNDTPPVLIRRSTSSAESSKPIKHKGAMAELAQQPLVKRPELDSPDMKKLKRMILRGSRTRIGIGGSSVDVDLESSRSSSVSTPDDESTA